MIDYNTVFLFLFFMSLLNVMNVISKIIRALLQTNPNPIRFSDRSLFILFVSISYLLTYILKS
jgi:hypothetical protein